MIYTIVIGFVIGLVARFLMPGRDAAGFIVTILLGIAGSFVGSYLGQAMGFYLPGQPAGFLMSVVGAMILLFGFRMVQARS
ncbi:MAG: GlsB/YeaQ/YmgE family stress response membrane protein [Acidobacteria bacterium]|nr:GlsB/YeaQ/YmgE family stress response membrane protein [Acidobacteriota bacterium]